MFIVTYLLGYVERDPLYSVLVATMVFSRLILFLHDEPPPPLPFRVPWWCFVFIMYLDYSRMSRELNRSPCWQTDTILTTHFASNATLLFNEWLVDDDQLATPQAARWMHECRHTQYNGGIRKQIKASFGSKSAENYMMYNRLGYRYQSYLQTCLRDPDAQNFYYKAQPGTERLYFDAFAKLFNGQWRECSEGKPVDERFHTECYDNCCRETRPLTDENELSELQRKQQCVERLIFNHTAVSQLNARIVAEHPEAFKRTPITDGWPQEFCEETENYFMCSFFDQVSGKVWQYGTVRMLDSVTNIFVTLVLMFLLH